MVPSTLTDLDIIMGRCSQKGIRQTVLAGFLGVLLLVWNCMHPVFRTMSALANYRIMIAALLLPWPLGVLSWWVRPLWARSTGMMAGGMLGILFLLPASCAGLEADQLATSGSDPSFKVTSEVQLSHSRIRAYQTDGGATTDFGLVVRQEMQLVPGLLLVRDVYFEYHAQGGRLESKLDGRVLVYPKRDRAEGPPVTLCPARYVWF